MPSYSKRLAGPQNAGAYRTRVFVYGPALGVDSTGGVIRNPPGIGKLAGGAQPGGTMLWQDRGECLPYGGSDRSEALREVTTMLWTVEVRWGRNKPYTAGMIIFVPGTGESFQVNSVAIIETAFKKVLLTCRVMA